MWQYFTSAIIIFLLELLLVYLQYTSKLIYWMRSKVLLAFYHAVLFSLLLFCVRANISGTNIFYACYVLLYITATEIINEKCCVEYRFNEYAKDKNRKILNRHIGISVLLTLVVFCCWRLYFANPVVN